MQTDEQVLQQALIGAPTRFNGEGEREIYDPVSGLWFTDIDMVRQIRVRDRRRGILGSTRDTYSLNGAGL